jgi:hypothetical protein
MQVDIQRLMETYTGFSETGFIPFEGSTTLTVTKLRSVSLLRLALQPEHTITYLSFLVDIRNV